MDLRQFRAVVAVADRRHFTRAAADLHIAQPALSQQVRRLEAELGLELFRRTSRSVALTQAGELILPRARRILAEVDGIAADLGALRGVVSGQVAIGSMQSLGPFDLPGLMAAFHRDHPGVDLLLREATTRRMRAMLAADELDLAVLTLSEEPPGLESRLIYEEDLVLALRPGHPLAARRRVSPARLPAEPWVFFAPGSGLRTLTEQVLEAAGITPRARFESNELTRVRALVSAGLGVAIMPRSDTEGPGPPVATVGIGPPAPRRRVGLAWRAGRRRPPAAEAFLQFALARLEAGAPAPRT